ncbi:MAG: ATP-binding cassette domain-containing protein [Actinomycetaceae bacterium]|nr:ATP-binding cassette domain-containing protein [Actinomycetaceae bacterium]
MNHNAIEVEGLSQRYGKNVVLDGLSFSIPRGGVSGLLGPNGAGKTTLLHTLTGILQPAAGSIRMMGQPMEGRGARRKVLANLSFLPQDFSADPWLTVQEFVEYNLWMRTFPKDQTVDAATQAIERVGLTGDAKKKIKELSGGMRQRAGIAAAIAGEPRIIILDEPTAGLDPEQRSQFRDILRQLDSTVLLSTHLIEDVESVATHLLVLSDGRIVHDGSPDVLVRNGDRSVQALEQQYIALLRHKKD